jgi:hypothetical protein
MFEGVRSSFVRGGWAARFPASAGIARGAPSGCCVRTSSLRAACPKNDEAPSRQTTVHRILGELSERLDAGGPRAASLFLVHDGFSWMTGRVSNRGEDARPELHQGPSPGVALQIHPFRGGVA